MGKIRYTIRLYRIHDLDLITFVEQHEFNIAKAIYSSLSAFSKGDHFIIEIPPKRKAQLPDLKRVYRKPIYLDEEKDKAAIELLDKIQKGYRNNFLKNLLRLYLCTPVSVSFLNDENDEAYFYKLFEIFKENKRIAKAGKLHTKLSTELEIDRIARVNSNDNLVKEKSEPSSDFGNEEKSMNETKQINNDENKTSTDDYESNDSADITSMFSGLF